MNIPDLLHLASIPGIGAQRLRQLINYFKSPTAVLSASPIELIAVEGIEKKLASAIAHTSRNQQFIDDQLSRLNKVNGTLLTLWDDAYPELLKKIYDPPPILFVKGTLTAADKFSLAVVGTRRPTQYGKLTAEQFGHTLAENSITLVSGLARGIDTIVHNSALQKNGRTIAVIGSSLDIMYPKENTALAERIEASGAVVSEFFMGTKPDPGNFPRRNRIISGMSLGTLLIESDLDGGAMITAEFANDQGREVFCIPGNITQQFSRGTNKLIQEGRAKLVQSVDDMFEELQVPLRPLLHITHQQPLPALTMFEQKLVDVLSHEPLHIDNIAEHANFSTSDALVYLLSLEFKGVVRQLAGKMFIKIL